ncbi:hypothetical protein Sinac_0711 [Singulisphaera acidiphila DSM 18658]|uniref:Uncharacterized protein n=1 Tax=Singulisphaera acidiphila (strain ATCC BAA-1392 / DSM 18658 / VKM B-2454 / MOB10) TaxID=886293 RepID=L0D7A2_SINAD|nr:hypothetical protein Sinac_0711 [Singulisphaera acidiphila DSM 18658]
MQLKTILNRVHPLKSFVYEQVRLVEKSGVPVIEIVIQPRAKSLPACSGCGRKQRGYDRQSQRCFQFIPDPGHAYSNLLMAAPTRVPST